jgi:sigma-B regulation protein RsbU (phosphoserine phosphatase)
MPRLVIQHRDGRRTVVALSDRPVRVGRGADCDIDLGIDDAEVSRRHAEVRLDADGRVLVTDLRSKNGTRVDGGPPFWQDTRVAERTIHVGQYELRIAGTGISETAATAASFGPDRPTADGDFTAFPSSRALNLSQERLQMLMQLTERINSRLLDRRQLLEQALAACCETFGFERGLIAVKTTRGDTEAPVTHNVRPEQISRTLINRALVDGMRTIVNDVASDLDGHLTESLVRFPICSALCVPIQYRDEIFGVVYGDRVTRAAARPYQPDDVDFLAAMGQQLGLALANARLLVAQVRVEQMERELVRAREMQQQLLRCEPLLMPGLHAEGHNEPSAGVSGDYVDFLDLDGRRLGFVIADVVGHGLAAALLATNLQAAVHVALGGSDSLSDMMRRINRLICRNTAAHVFITAILGVADTTTGEVAFICAGHPAPLVLGQGPPDALAVHGALPLGLDEDENYETHRVTLAPGSSIVFYTDGLTEASNPDGQLLGLEPVCRTLGDLNTLGTADIIQALRGLLRQHLAGHPNEDDMTLLALHAPPRP